MEFALVLLLIDIVDLCLTCIFDLLPQLVSDRGDRFSVEHPVATTTAKFRSPQNSCLELCASHNCVSTPFFVDLGLLVLPVLCLPPDVTQPVAIPFLI